MILVIGGQASGKRTYVANMGFGPDSVADGVLDGRPVVVNLQEALRDEERTPEQLAAELAGKQVVSCCEVGSGIVPLDPAERAWREKVGRTCNLLAERAESVVRMVCGIPVVLK